MTYTPHKRWKIGLRFRWKSGDGSSILLDPLGFTRPQLRTSSLRSIRLQWDWSPGRKWQLRQRIELKKEKTAIPGNQTISIPAESGLLTYIDAVFRPVRAARLSSRLYLFTDDRGSSAFYNFERGHPGDYRNSYLSGQGYRWYKEEGELSI